MPEAGFPPDPARHPSLHALSSILARMNPLLRRALEEAAPRDEEYLAFAEEHCRDLLADDAGHPVDPEQAVRAYVRICFEHFRAQSFLMKHGRYAASNYEELRRQVYENDETMDGYYLDGLYLTTVFWPNHYRLMRIFLDRFVTGLPPGCRYGEMAVGPGTYVARALAARPDLRAEVFDLSASALAYTRRLLLKRGVDPRRFALTQCDVRRLETVPDAAYDAVVMGELVEHLPDPASVLAEARRVLRPGGRLFLTTAINAGAVDHIYLFRETAEARALVESEGFRVVEEHALPLRESSPEEQVREMIPINYAVILAK